MLTAIARLSLRAPRRLAAVALVVFIVFAVVGGPTAGLLKDRNSFQDPSSQSARAERAIQRATGSEFTAGVLALVDAPPSSPKVAEVAQLLAGVPGVATVATPAGGRDRAVGARVRNPGSTQTPLGAQLWRRRRRQSHPWSPATAGNRSSR